MFYFLCDILWPEVQSHSDNSRMHATGLSSLHSLAQARPTVSCIHLVIVRNMEVPFSTPTGDAYDSFFDNYGDPNNLYK